MKRLAIALAGALALMLPAPAAEADYVTQYPTPAWYLTRKAGDRGHNLDVIVEAPRRALRWHKGWGLRRVAKNYDRRIDGLKVHFGKCSRHPNWRCVKVKARDFGPNGYYGLTRFYPRDNADRLLEFNGFYSHLPKVVACHEFGHALGLPHHESPGCVHRNRKYPSPLEVRALRRAY